MLQVRRTRAQIFLVHQQEGHDINDMGEYESMSEDEYNALNKVATMQSAQEESSEIYCDGDNNPSLVVARALTTNVQLEEDQRCNLFQTRAGINGKSIKVIIDGEVATT